jgi:SAM-dependent methyltransferase
MKSLIKSILPQRFHGPLKVAACRAFATVYAGDRFECPFCSRRFRRMIPRGLKHGVLTEKHVVGGGWRRDAFCPGCSSYDRERLVYLYLKHCTDAFTRPGRVLHVAPERILEKIFRAVPGIDYLTGDLFSEVVDVKLDVTNIQFADNSLDLVLCNHVLEHVPDDGQAMREILRVLKPGGLAVLQTPISLVLEATDEELGYLTREDRIRRFGQEDHCRIYAQDYPDRLRRAGFKVEVFDWTTQPADFGGPQNRYALNPEEALFACRKPAS